MTCFQPAEVNFANRISVLKLSVICGRNYVKSEGAVVLEVKIWRPAIAKAIFCLCQVDRLRLGNIERLG